MKASSRATALTLLAALLAVVPALAQGRATWLLAEGANNAVLSEEILVGNPGASVLDVTVTLLPQPDAIATVTSKTFALAPTARLTVRLGADFGLNGSASARVSAVLAGTTTPADIVVERTMYFPGDSRAGAHNAGGVTQLAPRWTLAEGATTVFDTFVLVANPNPTATRVRATYLTVSGTELVSELDVPANGRVTFWPRAEHGALASAEFSTFVESLTPGNDVVAERAMYFDSFRSGHDAPGVAEPSTTWLPTRSGHGLSAIARRDRGRDVPDTGRLRPHRPTRAGEGGAGVPPPGVRCARGQAGEGVPAQPVAGPTIPGWRPAEVGPG